MENDGFDLGAQRRPIDKNDLPHVRAEIAAYMQRLRAGEARRDIQLAPAALAAESRGEYAAGDTQPGNGLIVEKERVVADGEYTLSGGLYTVVAKRNDERQTEGKRPPLPVAFSTVFLLESPFPAFFGLGVQNDPCDVFWRIGNGVGEFKRRSAYRPLRAWVHRLIRAVISNWRFSFGSHFQHLSLSTLYPTTPNL